MVGAVHSRWSGVACPVIGMIHLSALPGAPRYAGSPQSIEAAALADAEALVEGGVDGLMIENFGDVPFMPARVEAVTVSHMTAIAAAVRGQWSKVPLGINVLRNDGRSALAIAHAIGAQFIRVNVLCGARLADQGILNGIAHDLMRDRAALGAGSIDVWADVQVKHSVALGPCPIEHEVADVKGRGLADAIIVSGAATGSETDPDHLDAVRRVAGDVPVLVGSGVTVQTVASLAGHCDGVIVGTAVKRDGVAANPVDVSRVRDLLKQVR
ncbi:MAG: phosphorybosylanthranilate isomerase [Phycisphaeraceae bacterium]|nr:phosphorybosylanthranilate isomerase [Phycisphaeraceae bacterium]